MKKFILFALFLAFFFVGYYAKAADNCKEEVTSTHGTERYTIGTDVPNYLKGATITVTLADGKTSTVPAEKFKVVARKQQFLMSMLETTKVITCAGKKSRLSVLGGYGAKNGLKTTSSGSTVTVESASGAMAGAQYQYMLNDTLSVGVQGQTNETGSILFGIDF